MKNINWTHPRVIADCFLMSRPGFIEFYQNEYGTDPLFNKVVWIGVRDAYPGFDRQFPSSSALKHLKPEEFAKVKLEIQTIMQKMAIDLKEEVGVISKASNDIDEVFTDKYTTKKKKVFRLLELGSSTEHILSYFKVRNLVIDPNYIKELTVLYKKENG